MDAICPLYIIVNSGGGKSYTYKKIKYVCGVYLLVFSPHKFKLTFISTYMMV